MLKRRQLPHLGQYWIADAFDLYSYDDDGARRLTPVPNAPPCPRPICEVPDATTWFTVGLLPGRLDWIARFDGNRWDVFTANALMQLAGVAAQRVARHRPAALHPSGC
jgi:hypothetical protein